MYKFYVEYELERDERNAQAEYVPEGKPFALLWIQFLGNHSVAKVLQPTTAKLLNSRPI